MPIGLIIILEITRFRCPFIQGEYLGWVDLYLGSSPRLVGHYCSYLLPKQDGGTAQIIPKLLHQAHYAVRPFSQDRGQRGALGPRDRRRVRPLRRGRRRQALKQGKEH